MEWNAESGGVLRHMRTYNNMAPSFIIREVFGLWCCTCIIRIIIIVKGEMGSGDWSTRSFAWACTN